MDPWGGPNSGNSPWGLHSEYSRHWTTGIVRISFHGALDGSVVDANRNLRTRMGLYLDYRLMIPMWNSMLPKRAQIIAMDRNMLHNDQVQRSIGLSIFRHLGSLPSFF